jgi:hypothetical protein
MNVQQDTDLVRSDQADPVTATGTFQYGAAPQDFPADWEAFLMARSTFLRVLEGSSGATTDDARA